MIETSTYLGRFNLTIREMKIDNLTLLSARSGAGKTYLVSKRLQEMEGTKLLLASEYGCNNEYLSIGIDQRIPYYSDSWNVSSSEILDSMFLNISEYYQTIIIEDIPILHAEEYQSIISTCLKYRKTDFVLIGLSH